jgi:hypothetical protein
MRARKVLGNCYKPSSSAIIAASMAAQMVNMIPAPLFFERVLYRADKS